MLSENRFPYFKSCNSYGDFSVGIYDNIQKTDTAYNYKKTDTAFHKRWEKGLSHPNPKTKWDTLREIEENGVLNRNFNTQEQFKFRDFIKSEDKQFEMAQVNFGDRSNWKMAKDMYGKDHTTAPDAWLKWVHGKMQAGEEFPMSDQGQRLNKQQQLAAIQGEIDKRAGKPINSPQRPQPIKPPQQSIKPPQKPNVKWTLARTNDTNQEVVLSKNPDGNWSMMDREGNIEFIPASDLQTTVTSVKDSQGKQLQSINPQELFSTQQTQQTQSKSNQTGTSKGYPTHGRNEKPLTIPKQLMSQYNVDIEQTFENTNGNIMIDALAGTGKTTMLKHLSSMMKPGEKWLYLVFNNKNQKEARPAFPEGVTVQTAHSYVGDVLKDNGMTVGGNTSLPGKEDPSRISRILDNMLDINFPPTKNMFSDRNTGDMINPFHRKAKKLVEKIASLAKAFACDPQDSSFMAKLHEIVKKYNFDMDLSTDKLADDVDLETRTQQILNAVANVVKITLPNSMPRELGVDLTKLRDHDDTIWYGALYADKINWNKKGFKVVLLDEAQDFNECNLIMAKKLKESGARVIAVGDPNQSLYRFRGADADAFDRLKTMVADGPEFVKELPINFRSEKAVIDFIVKNTHVKNLQWNDKLDPNAGEATTHHEYEGYMGNLTSMYGKDRKFSDSQAIISRGNTPLAATAMSLLKNNIDFEILGKDLSGDLIKHINRIASYNKIRQNDMQNLLLNDLPDLLNDFDTDMRAKWGNKISKADELQKINDATSALTSVLEQLRNGDDPTKFNDESGNPMTTAVQLIKYLKVKLSGKDPDNEKDMEALAKRDPLSYVTLTTAHKSKGLEWGQVFVLRPKDFDPAGPKIRTKEDAQQERNAWFVALSRAKKSINVSANDEP